MCIRDRDIGNEQRSADSHVNPMIAGGDEDAYDPHSDSRKEIQREPRYIVPDGVANLAHNPACYHHSAVAGQCSPRATHIAEFRHEQNVECERNGEATEREYHAPVGTVGEFVPKRQIEKYAEKEFSNHYHRHNFKSGKVMRGDEVAQDGDCLLYTSRCV